LLHSSSGRICEHTSCIPFQTWFQTDPDPIQTKCSYIPGIPHDHCNLLIRSNAAQEEAEKEEDHGSKEAREAKEGSERRLGSIPDGCGKL